MNRLDGTEEKAAGRILAHSAGGTLDRAKPLCFDPPANQRGMADNVKAKDKFENPKAQFDKPKEIVQDKALSHHEKKNALNTWEQDEQQLLTASLAETRTTFSGSCRASLHLGVGHTMCNSDHPLNACPSPAPTRTLSVVPRWPGTNVICASWAADTVKI
jgi:hypothetical protein